MKNFTANRRGITSTVKVVALVLIVFASGISAGSLLLWSFSQPGEEVPEVLELSNEHVWGHQDGWIEAAIVAINKGESNVAVKKVAVLSEECEWNNIYYWKTDTGPIASELNSTPVELYGQNFAIEVDNVERTFQRAQGEIGLDAGWTLVLYLRDPFNFTLHKDAKTVPISIFTEKTLYYKEAVPWMGALTVVFMQTEELKFINYGWDTSSPTTYIVLNVKNTGSQPVTITDVRVSDALAYVDGESVLSETLEAGGSISLNITRSAGAPYTAYTSGVKYEFTVNTAKGNSFGPYIKTAP